MRTPLPHALVERAFRTSSHPDLGLTRHRLRAVDVEHPFREISSIGLDLTDVRDLCRTFLPVMRPGHVFTHTTSLALLGAPLPRLPLDLHVSVVFPGTPPSRPGVVGHALKEVPLDRSSPIPRSPASIAWAQSAALLSREDLTAVADHFLTAGVASHEELVRVADSWTGRPGAARLRWAIGRARPGARSRPETLLRLMLVRARLPEPVIEHPVVVRGGPVLHPDLAYPESRLAIEYEGDIHRSRESWERDILRREMLAGAGWRTIRVTATQLFGDPLGLAARVRRHLA